MVPHHPQHFMQKGLPFVGGKTGMVKHDNLILAHVAINFSKLDMVIDMQDQEVQFEIITLHHG